MKLVMVGNRMAGIRTPEQLFKVAPDVYDITVFGAEPHANYNRILLSPVLAGEMTIEDSCAVALDAGCARRYPVRVEARAAFLQISPA